MKERAWTERGASSSDSIRTEPDTPVRPSILLVEDDDDTRELMVTLLGMSGFQTLSCRTAEEGLEQLRESLFDLVLTDYCLPRRTGGWLLKQASAEGLLDSTPALVVTAHPGPDETNGFEVILKPFETDALVDRVRQLTTHD
jgi:CheY-like chemotaxis protein